MPIAFSKQEASEKSFIFQWFVSFYFSFSCVSEFGAYSKEDNIFIAIRVSSEKLYRLNHEAANYIDGLLRPVRCWIDADRTGMGWIEVAIASANRPIEIESSESDTMHVRHILQWTIQTRLQRTTKRPTSTDARTRKHVSMHTDGNQTMLQQMLGSGKFKQFTWKAFTPDVPIDLEWLF